MAKVVLDIESNLQGLETAFSKGNEIISHAQAAVKSFGVDSKSAYTTASQEAAKFSDIVKNGGQSVTNLGKTASGFQSLVKEIRALTAQAIELKKNGDLIGADATIKSASKLREELTLVQKSIQSISKTTITNLATGFRSATQLGLQGFEGIIAAEGLFGKQTDEVQKQLLKLQSVIALTNVIGDFGELKNKFNDIKLAFAPLQTLYVKGNEALKSWGKTGVEAAVSVGAANKGFFKTFASDIKSFVTGGISSIKTLWAAMAANPLGILLTAIGAIVALFVIFREKIADLIGPFRTVLESMGLVADKQEKLARKTIELTKLQEEVTASRYDAEIAQAEAAGKRTFEIEDKKSKDLQNFVQKRIDALLLLFQKNRGFQDDELKEFQDALKLQQKLQDDSVTNKVKEQKKIQDFEKETQNKIAEMRIAGIKNDQKREEEALAQKFLTEINATEDRIKMVFGTEAERIAAETPIVKAAQEAYERELSAIRKKYADQRLERQKELLALQKQFEDELQNIISKRENGELENTFGEAKLAKEREISIKEVEILKDNLTKRGQAINDFEAKIKGTKPTKFSLTTDQLEQFTILERQVYEKETDGLVQLTIDRANKIAEANAQAAKQTEDNLSTTEAGLIASVEIAPKPEHKANANAVRAQQQDEAFERAKQNAILNIQKEYAVKKLELQQQTLRAEYDQNTKALEGELLLLRTRNDEDATIRKAQINKSLDLLDQKFTAENGKMQDETAKLVNGLQSQQNTLNKKPPFDLFKMLGITPNELSQINSALQQVTQDFDSVLQLKLQQVDADISNSQKREQTAQSEVDNLSSKLNAEKQLAETGKANNEDAIQAQIKQQQQAVDKEKVLQQQSLDEKKRIQKEKLALDTAAQISNLITTSAQILTSAHDPITLGLALGTVAVMLTGFAIAKAKAFKAVNSGSDVQSFSRGVIDLHGKGTETSDDIPANLSVGESVMTAKETRKNKKLFQGIRLNNDKLLMAGILNLLNGRAGLQKEVKEVIESKSERANEVRSIMERASSPIRMERVLREIVKGTNISIPNDLPAQLSAKRDAMQKQELNSFINNDFASLQKEQRETNNRLDKLIEANKEKLFSDGNGAIISKKGTHTMIKRDK